VVKVTSDGAVASVEAATASRERAGGTTTKALSDTWRGAVGAGEGGQWVGGDGGGEGVWEVGASGSSSSSSSGSTQ
jgi:hypothetical protein